MWYLTIARTVLASLGSMASALLSEVFLKDAVIVILEKLVKRYPSESHDKLLEAVKHAWGLSPEGPK